MRFLLILVAWCLLLVLCWPLALAVALLAPLLWILALPFRLAFLVVEGTIALVRTLIFLPARVLGHRGRT